MRLALAKLLQALPGVGMIAIVMGGGLKYHFKGAVYFTAPQLLTLVRIGLIFFINLYFFTDTKAITENKIIIKIKMPERSITRMRYLNFNQEIVPVTFTNNSDKEEVLSKEIYIKEATVFRYDVQMANEKFIHQLLVLPNDTVKLMLNPNGNINYDNHTSAFIEEIIDLYENLDISKLNDRTLSGYYQQIEITREMNIRVTDSLLKTGKVTNQFHKALKRYNDLLFYKGYLKPVVITAIKNNPRLDSLFFKLETDIKKYDGLSAIDLVDVYDKMITYKMIKRNDQSLLSYMMMIESNHLGNIGLLLASRKMDMYDSKSALEYKQALKYLEVHFPKLVNPRKVLDDILSVPLVNLIGSGSSLNIEISNLTDKGIIVLDFWASWCKPCLDEFQHLQAKMLKLKSRNINFIGINMDTDINNKAWVETSGKIALSADYKNYRLTDKYKARMTRFFKINSIPRYIILNKDKGIVDFDFINPSNDRFEDELIEFLNDLKRK